MKNQCERYWAFADHIPLDDVVSYWCEKTGFDDDHCKNGKRAAIVSACKLGDIKYGRSDGKSFNDPPDVLAGRNILTIERESFDTWVTENFENESPLPEKPFGTNERKTLLTIIAALAKEAKINLDPPGKAAVFIENLTDKLGAHVSKRAIEDHLKKIPDALETRMK